MGSIVEHFVPPRPLALPVFAPGPMRTRMLRPEQRDGDSLTTRAAVLYGMYTFTVRRSGRKAPVSVTVPSLVPAFDSSIVAAISRADSSATLVARALDVDSLLLELRVSTGPDDPRLRFPPTTLFSADFPRVRLVDAKPIGVVPLAEYPPDERDEGGDGEVVLRVVVDATGAAMIPTIEVQHATSPAFALAAARALARYHFAPAHVDGCPVSQVVEVPFWFSLRP
jgi:hypothetical protein